MTRFSDTVWEPWGRVGRTVHRLGSPTYVDECAGLISATKDDKKPLLGVGLGRSYGDSVLNPDGALIQTTKLDRFIAFDPSTGILRAEAGLSLWDVIEFAGVRGYFLPTTPGARYVTLGGAVANDVHGKNHHGAGTFGRHVKRIGLIRSDGEELTLSQDENVDMFAATIGGLGLTGLIIWVEFVLVPVPSLQIDQETIAFQSLEEFFVLARESETSFEHTVAWIDCAAQGQKLGRGIFSRGNWSKEGGAKISERKAIVRMPFPAPGFVLNKWSVGAFNEAYFSLNQRRAGRSVVSYDTFFYPLDAIGAWNLMYGAKGFYQYQSVVPPQDALETTRRMLEVISKSGQGSFLAVLKTFGDVPSPGMLSFPSEGTTLALDFPNRGEKTLNLLGKLDEIVTEAGGRLYPAKDGRMPPSLFWQGFPKADAFTEYVDPGFSSSFWQRMIQERT